MVAYWEDDVNTVNYMMIDVERIPGVLVGDTFGMVDGNFAVKGVEVLQNYSYVAGSLVELLFAERLPAGDDSSQKGRGHKGKKVYYNALQSLLVSIPCFNT